MVESVERRFESVPFGCRRKQHRFESVQFKSGQMKFKPGPLGMHQKIRSDVRSVKHQKNKNSSVPP